MITSDQLKDVMERTEALHRYLDIDNKRVQLEEEQLRTQAPDFWDDPKRAEEQMKKVKSIQKWVEGYDEIRKLSDELQLAFDFYKDEMVSEQEVDDDYSRAIKSIEDLELKNMLRQEEDPMDCVLKINSGAGGLNPNNILEARDISKAVGFDLNSGVEESAGIKDIEKINTVFGKLKDF